MAPAKAAHTKERGDRTTRPNYRTATAHSQPVSWTPCGLVTTSGTMFTGLVAVTGTVASVQPRASGVGARIALRALYGDGPGGRVNLEVDLVARYVARFLSAHE
jgi:hypothetical protein